MCSKDFKLKIEIKMNKRKQWEMLIRIHHQHLLCVFRNGLREEKFVFLFYIARRCVGARWLCKLFEREFFFFF